MTAFCAGAGVDDHDIEWLQRMTDPLELLIDLSGGHNIAVRKMASASGRRGS
jgi:hypothetical protein